MHCSTIKSGILAYFNHLKILCGLCSKACKLTALCIRMHLSGPAEAIFKLVGLNLSISSNIFINALTDILIIMQYDSTATALPYLGMTQIVSGQFPDIEKIRRCATTKHDCEEPKKHHSSTHIDTHHADGKTKWTYLWWNYSTARKVRQTSRVASQYISEADSSKLLWLDCASCFTLARPIPYVQAAILTAQSLYVPHSVIIT